MRQALILFILSIFLTSSSWACLKPTGPILAEVVDLGPNPGGLEQVEVHVSGFDLAGPVAIGCTIGLGMGSQILPSPTWAIQRRGITTELRIVDAVTNTVHHDFFLNSFATWDLNAETLGLGYFTWPMPVWFLPFTTTSHQALNGSLPQGPVTLIFDVVIKPGSTVNDFIDDLIAFGHVANDYSWTDFPSGMTWLLWTSTRMVSKIDTVMP